MPNPITPPDSAARPIANPEFPFRVTGQDAVGVRRGAVREPAEDAETLRDRQAGQRTQCCNRNDEQ